MMERVRCLGRGCKRWDVGGDVKKVVGLDEWSCFSGQDSFGKGKGEVGIREWVEIYPGSGRYSFNQIKA